MMTTNVQFLNIFHYVLLMKKTPPKNLVLNSFPFIKTSMVKMFLENRPCLAFIIIRIRQARDSQNNR